MAPGVTPGSFRTRRAATVHPWLCSVSSAPGTLPPVAETDDATKIDELPFEAALARLEGLIERVESGEASLEDALRDHRTGTQLIERCREVLDRAEVRMAELVAGSDGKARIQEAGA